MVTSLKIIISLKHHDLRQLVANYKTIYIRNEQIAFCQMCVCIFHEAEHIITYQPVSLSGEILDIVDIEESNIILVKYYKDGNIEFKIFDKEKDLAELEKYYINEIIYDETENILKQTKLQYLEHIKKKIIYYI